MIFKKPYTQYVGKWIKETSYGWPRYMFIMGIVPWEGEEKNAVKVNVVKIEELDYEDSIDYAFFELRDTGSSLTSPKVEHLHRAIKAAWRKK
jgi:hypothetical protein